MPGLRVREAGRRFLAAIVIAALASSLAPTSVRGDSLSELTFTMLREVKRLRGLEPATPVGLGLRSPEELRTLLTRRINEEYTPGQLKALQRLLALTGLIPADYDLIERYVSLLASQALGFYDFKTETFFLSSSVDPTLHAAVVLHELTHALQDQNFHIYRRLKELEDDEDARTALQSLIEGEATALMLEFSLEGSGRPFYSLTTDELVAFVGSQQEAFKGEPPVMRDFLYFPYEAGLPFLKHLRSRGPWAGLDGLHARPPASTEQVLHPERYLGGAPDPPRAVRWGEAALPRGGGWRQLDANNLGELGAYLLVRPFSADDVEAREAAAGWGGDRYLVLEQAGGGRAVALMVFAWDTERDAEEFEQAYRRAASSRSPSGGAERGPGGEGFVVRQEAGLTYLERRGDKVLVVEGLEAGELDGFRGLGWSAQVQAAPAAAPPATVGLARREALRRRAESLLKRGQAEEAAGAAAEAVAISAGDAEALYLLGAAQLLRDATLAEGIDHLNQAASIDPRLGPAQLELGLALLDLSLAGEARAHLLNAQTIMPDDPRAASAYASVLLEEGQAAEAQKALARWASGRLKDPEVLSLLGRAALERRELAEARARLEVSLSLDPSSAAAHRAMGALELKDGDPEAALEHLKQAVELEPKGAASLVALGEYYASRGLAAEAREAYRQAASLDQRDPAAAASLGRMALEAGDLAGAEAWFGQALASDPRWRPALEGMKAVLEKQGRPAERLDALLARPESVDASVRKAMKGARRCMERGLLRRARQQFEVAVRLDGDHPGAWAGLGRVHEREERFGLAGVAYMKALSSPDPLPLEDRDRLLRWVAVQKPDGASGPVLKRFINSTDDGERQRAALALGALGDKRVAPLLADHLEGSSPAVQAALAEALGMLGEPSSESSLERLEASSADPEVRSAARRALDRLKQPAQGGMRSRE